MTDFNQKTHDTDVGSHGGQSRQMMEVFENQEFGSIRLLQEAGKTFFCASDVAKALGYVNPYAAVKRHCRGPLTKREGVVQKVNQYGDAGEQVVEISFITEGDVYRLIVHSKLPSAERFEHWVFDEVLPSIRKHGVYMSDSILDQVIQHPEVIYTLAQELVAEREQLEGIRKQLDLPIRAMMCRRTRLSVPLHRRRMQQKAQMRGKRTIPTASKSTRTCRFCRMAMRSLRMRMGT